MSVLAGRNDNTVLDHRVGVSVLAGRNDNTMLDHRVGVRGVMAIEVE